MIILPNGTMQQQPEADDSQNAFTGFLKSTISSIPETFGTDPLPGVEGFRRDHPYLGFGSEMAGMAIPYTGWFKAAKGISLVAKGAKAAEEIVGGAKAAPFLAGAARTLATDAPFEAARIAASTVTGDNTPDVAISAATNLALGGALGGIGGKLAAGGTAIPKVPELSSEVDMTAPRTVQLRQLKQALSAGTVKSEDAAKYWVSRMTDDIRREAPHGDTNYVGDLEGGQDVSRLNRLFKTPKNATSIVGRRFVPEDYTTDAAYVETLAKSGLVGKEDFVKFPRLVAAQGKGVGNVESTITDTLTQISPDTWMAKEADDGLYVMAKRVEAQAATRGKKGVPGNQESNQWVLFKTDSPGTFAPLGDAWTQSLTKMAKFAPDTNAPIGTPLNDAYQTMLKNFPLQNYTDTVATGRLGSMMADMRQHLGIDRMNGTARQTAESTYRFVKEHVSPTMFQFTKSPRAAYIFNVARNLYQFADAQAAKLLNGEAKLDGTQSLFRSVLKGAASTGEVDGLPALKPLIRGLSEEDKGQLWLAWAQHWKPERVQEALLSGEISPKTHEVLNIMGAHDAKQMDEVMRTQDAFNLVVNKPAAGHIMVSHTWSGSHRIPILDADGNLVTLAAGKSRGAAQEEAATMLAGGKDHGFNWKLGDPFMADSSTELQKLLQGATDSKIDLGSRQFQVANAVRVAAQRARMRPSFLRERSGVGGFVGEKAPWTTQELEDIVSHHVGAMQRYQAKMHVENVLNPQLMKLASEDSNMYHQVMARLDDLHGIPAASAQIQNKISDKSPLGAILGSNSASKAVALMNAYTHHNQLGFGNITFPLLNAMSPLMTTMPQLAYVLKAAPEDLQRMGYYSWQLAGDAAGKPKTGLGFLQMAKLAKQSFAEMGKPGTELNAHLAQAAHEGAWSNSLNHDVVGPESAIGDQLKNVLNGKGGLPGMLIRWSNMLPEISERFARIQSFTLGHIVGRDIKGLEGDNLYRFAKRFTEASNFSYGTADRARVITGPMGSLFGLYKNWQMHYAGWMLEYLNQGVKHGNWTPLLAQTLGTAATGGIGSLAGFSAMDKLSQLVTDKDLMQHVYANFGPTGKDGQSTSDAVYFGLPAFLGASLQGSATQPGNNPVRDAAMMFSFVQWDRMKALGSAIGNAWDMYDATGRNPMLNEGVRSNVARALAPRSIYRAIAATDEGFIRSLNTGYPTASASTGERVLYALGLNPVQVEKQMIISDKLWRDQDAMKNAVQAYGKAMVAAEGDPEAMRAVMLRAMADGVPIDSVTKSAKSRQTRMGHDVLSRQFQPLKVQGYQDVLGTP